MQNKDMFVWCGHGEPAIMLTGEGNWYDVYATEATYNIRDDLSSGSLTDEIVWYQGCSQAVTDSSYGNLLHETVEKADHGCEAYGVDINYGISTARTWNSYTWNYMYNRDDVIGECIYDAANTAGQNDLYGFDSTHVWCVLV